MKEKKEKIEKKVTKEDEWKQIDKKKNKQMKTKIGNRKKKNEQIKKKRKVEIAWNLINKQNYDKFFSKFNKWD